MGSLPKAPTRDHQIRNIVRGACLILIVGVSVAYVLAGARQPWDFQIYYYASSAYRSGLDPYSTTALSGVAGKHVELQGVDVFRFDADGKVDTNTVYYDGADFARQIGMLPPRDSALDRGVLTLFNTGTRLRQRFTASRSKA